MSSRRSSPSSSPVATDRRITDLISKLQALLPNHANHGKVSRADVLHEACLYIRRLHEEIDDLSERLSELLELSDRDHVLLRSLLNNVIDI